MRNSLAAILVMPAIWTTPAQLASQPKWCSNVLDPKLARPVEKAPIAPPALPAQPEAMFGRIGDKAGSFPREALRERYQHMLEQHYLAQKKELTDEWRRRLAAYVDTILPPSGSMVKLQW